MLSPILLWIVLGFWAGVGLLNPFREGPIEKAKESVYAPPP